VKLSTVIRNYLTFFRKIVAQIFLHSTFQLEASIKSAHLFKLTVEICLILGYFCVTTFLSRTFSMSFRGKTSRGKHFLRAFRRVSDIFLNFLSAFMGTTLIEHGGVDEVLI
jgi:hypothetical protein